MRKVTGIQAIQGRRDPQEACTGPWSIGGRRFACALALLFLAEASSGQTEDEWRSWKSTTGTSIEAKLVASDGKQATLEKRDGKQIKVPLSQLSAADQTFLAARKPPAEPRPKGDDKPKGETTIKGVPAQPGTVSGKISCEADPKWSYWLYLPKDFHAGRSWPVCFIMDAGGGSEGTLARYQPAAEHLGMILAASTESKNDFADSDLAMMAMLKDVYARVPVLEKVAIASGMSGGSRMAYLMAEMDRNVSGVLACASGAGVYLKEQAFRPAKLRSDTAICSLIGTNDFNRREAVKSHKGFGKGARLIWFAGNHDWAGPDLIQDGLAEVYGRILERSKARGLDSLRADFSRKQIEWAKTQVTSAPWLAYHWGEFLVKFPGDAAVQRDAAALVASVANGPALVKAEKELQEFAGKYFADGDTKADEAADPSRVKAAEKVAAQVDGSPQAALIKLMGQPVNSYRPN
ncbi:MAG: SHD1 domain-containing protein [Verrucomicrobia bacterium]|nr:SHD1 domain-containing protein [Verrucomicrobiota bacterium]